MDQEQLLKYVCPIGEGKGRLVALGESVTFSYESLFEKEKALTLAIAVPFLNEKNFIIPVHADKKFSLQDDQEFIFFMHQKKLPPQIQKELSERVEYLFENLAQLLSYKAERMIASNFVFLQRDNEFIISNSSLEKKFQLKASDFKQTFFRKLEISVSDKAMVGDSDEVTLILYPSSCEF